MIDFSPRRLLGEKQLQIRGGLEFYSSVCSVGDYVVPSSVKAVLLFIPLPGGSAMCNFSILASSKIGSVVSYAHTPM